MTRNELFQAVKQLGLKPDDYIVIGSGVLCALDIREVDDIDLIVTEPLFREFENTGDWHKKYYDDGTYYLLKDSYEIGLDWDSQNAEPNLQDLKIDKLTIDNIPFISLARLKQWKLKMGRDKDKADIKLIEKYIRS